MVKSSLGPVEKLSEPFRGVNSKHPLQPGRVWTGETQILLRLLFPVETRRTTCQTVAANGCEIFWPRQFSFFFTFSRVFVSQKIRNDQPGEADNRFDTSRCANDRLFSDGRAVLVLRRRPHRGGPARAFSRCCQNGSQRVRK